MGFVVGIVVLVGTFIGGIIYAALSRQIADEFKAWTPWIVERLLSRAISQLPRSRRRRFEEEWRSHVNEVPGQIGKVVVALGFLSAARKMSSILSNAGEKFPAGTASKRFADLSFSATFLAFFAPLFLIVGALVKLEDG